MPQWFPPAGSSGRPASVDESRHPFSASPLLRHGSKTTMRLNCCTVAASNHHSLNRWPILVRLDFDQILGCSTQRNCKG